MSQAILCLGAAHWDDIGRAESTPTAGADLPGRIRRRPGGVALNVALALAAAGQPAALCAAIGRDAAGEALLDLARSRRIDCTLVLRHDGRTDRYLVLEGPDGAIFGAVADCESLERSGPALLAALQGAAPDWIVADGNLPAPILAALAALPLPAACRIALVAASPAKAPRAAPILAAGRARFYGNRAEAEALCAAAFADSAAAARALLDLGAQDAVVTDGARPASHAAHGSCTTAAPPAVRPRSLTGAGDAFVAAHLAATLDRADPRAALEAALAASARHITREAP